MKSCRLSHPGSGALSRQPWKASTISQLLSTRGTVGIAPRTPEWQEQLGAGLAGGSTGGSHARAL